MPIVTQLDAKILPGQRVEIPAPDFPEGETVPIVVVWPDAPRDDQRSALEILDSLPGQQLFKTPEEADEYLREERASWE